MALVVGPGMKAQMDANQDTPLSRHQWQILIDDAGNQYQEESCLGGKGLYVSSNSSGQWVNVGPLPVAA